MQPYIQPNTIRPFGGGIIHINQHGVHLVPAAAVAGEGGGGESSVMPVVRDTITSGNGSSAEPTWTVPGDVETGDLVIATISADSFTAIPLASGAPAGWNLLTAAEEAIPNIITLWGIVGSGGVVANGTPTLGLGAAALYISTCLAVSGANTSDPFYNARLSPDTLNQALGDPGSTTTRYYGRSSFITRAGIQGMPTKYDNSLVLATIAMDGNQQLQINNYQSGYIKLHDLPYTANQTLSQQYYEMPNIGLVPGYTLNKMGADSACGVGYVINPATLGSGTKPSVPYIAEYTTRYLASASQPIECAIPSGAEAGDLAVLIVTQGTNGSLIATTCQDDTLDSWTRDAYWFGSLKGFSVHSKVLDGDEATVTYDANSAAYQQATCLLVKGATSGVLTGVGQSGVSEEVSSTEIIGPSLGVYADGTLVIHGCFSRGAGNNNIQNSWEFWGIPNPDQPGQEASGIVNMGCAGATSSVSTTIYQTHNATGSGLLAPRWYCAANEPLGAFAISIY